MLHRLPWALALATCGVWGCAAISGLDGLDLGGDASTPLDATAFDAPAESNASDADAMVADASGGDADASVADTGAGCGNGKPCPADQSGCCSQYETCTAQGCCKSNGSSCFSSSDCCGNSVCTTGGTCQSSCTQLGGGCQTGSQDRCCRGQAYCASSDGGGSQCTTCVANDAGCSGDQQCCSHNCSSNSNTCKP